MNVATSAPAMPSSAVRKNPPGSRPGMISFASAPTTAPMITIQISSSIFVPPGATAPMPPAPSRFACSRNAKRLTDADQVRAVEAVTVGFEDLRVESGVAIVMLGERAQGVALLHDVP